MSKKKSAHVPPPFIPDPPSPFLSPFTPSTHLHQRVLEAGLGEAADGFLRVVHGQSHTGPLKLVDGVDRLGPPTRRLKRQGERARPRDRHVRRAVLVAVRVAADHDGAGPAGDEAGDVGHDDGL